MSPLAAPLLFAAARVLAIAAANPGQYRAFDLIVVLAAVTFVTGLGVAVVLAVLRLLERADRAAPLAGAVGLLGVAWFYYYVPSRSALAGFGHRIGGQRILAPLAVLATIAALAWLWRQPRGRLQALGAFLSRSGALLLVLVGAQAAVSEARDAGAMRSRGLARDLAAPVPTVPTPPGRNSPPRDIYLIVLDGHANARVLSESFGFDNSRFEDSLRALGFLVPRDMRSNYVQTYLSLASLLNFTQITRLAGDLGSSSTDHALPTYLVRHNRAANFLRKQGYRYVLFPSAWWAATATSPLADEEFDPHARFDLGYEIRRTELRQAVVRSSLLRYVLPRNVPQVPMVTQFLRSFEGLREVPSEPAPTFAFAHLLLPHIPYVLDGRCRPLGQSIADDKEADTPAQRAAYVAQVRCADRLVLELVTTLLRRSPTPPVILVVGDHGPRFADIGFYGHPARVSTAFVRERFGALGAFYLPAGGDSAFREPVTLVNVLGDVLRYYLGATLPRSDDAMYVSGEELYRFYPVDARLLAPDGPPPGAAP